MPDFVLSAAPPPTNTPTEHWAYLEFNNVLNAIGYMYSNFKLGLSKWESSTPAGAQSVTITAIAHTLLFALVQDGVNKTLITYLYGVPSVFTTAGGNVYTSAADGSLTGATGTDLIFEIFGIGD